MGAAAILQISRNGQAIKSQPVEGEIVAGRGEGCLLLLDDRAISRQHAVFTPVPGGLQVERKSEFAPVSVNGTEVTRAVLKEGDVVSIGPYLIRYQEEKTKLLQAAATAAMQLEQPLPMPEAAEAPAEQVVESQQAGPDQGPVNFQIEPPEFEIPGFGAQQAEESPLQISPPEFQPGLQPGIQMEAPFPSPDENEIPGMGGIQLEAPVPLELNSPDSNDLGPQILLPPPSQDSPPSYAQTADEDAPTRITVAGGIAAQLQLSEGAANVTSFDIEQDMVTIGRGKDCEIILNDRKASRKNAVIKREGGRFYIKDLGSANGTYVNEIKVDEVALSSDDVIRIGDVSIRFKAIDSEYSAKEKNFMPVPQQPDYETEPTPAANEAVPEFNYQPAPIRENQPSSSEYAPRTYSGQTVNPIGQVIGGVPGMPETGGGIPGIPGIAGISAPGASSKSSLLEKFRALPPKRQAIWAVIILGGLYYLLDEEPAPAPAPKAKSALVAKGAQAPSGQLPKGATFAALPAEQKANVERWHDLAFDHYKNREYDKSLFELNKIFALVPDFKDSREIERYAKEGKRQLETREAERRKREEEEKVKVRIAQLTQEISEKIAAKQYVQARELFAEVLTLDPDSEAVSQFRQQLEKVEEEQRIAEQEQMVREEIKARAREVLAEGQAYQKRGKFHSAIGAYGRVLEMGPADKKLVGRAKAGIAASRQAIAELRDPVLAEAKESEGSGELAKAYKLYEKARGIDPGHPDPVAGMAKIRGALHDKAKGLYTEAVLAESYSDFAVAKQKYKECIETAPKDDIYHERAERKLSRYFGKDELIAPPQ